MDHSEIQLELEQMKNMLLEYNDYYMKLKEDIKDIRENMDLIVQIQREQDIQIKRLYIETGLTKTKVVKRF